LHPRELSTISKPYMVQPPVTAEIEFFSVEMVNMASWVPSVELV
jgi:hypothetical protein